MNPVPLLTVGRMASELGAPVARVRYVLATRTRIEPRALAGHARLFDRNALAAVRYELNAIDARRAERQGDAQSKNERSPKTPKAGGPGIIPLGAVLTRAEACGRLGWCRTAYRQAKRGGLVVRRFGRNDYILADDLLRFFAAIDGDGGADDE